MKTLTLNDTTIAGYGLKVSCELALPEADLSGQSSSSATAEQGFKPKRLKVSLNIKFDEADVLTNILQLSIATDDDSGKRVVYNIDNQTAIAFGVRQVRFTDRVSAQEQDGSQAWSVSFVLVESLSISEKVEALRISETETSVATADASTAAESSSNSASWLDNVLEYLDNALSDEGS